jgi:hypothetical protein
MFQITKKGVRIAYSTAVLLIGIVSFGITIQSCSDYYDDEDINPNIIDTRMTKEGEYHNWKSQLEKIMNTPPAILATNGIELLGYEIISNSVDNSIDENNYKNAIKSDGNMIPFYSDDLKSIKAISKKEMILRSSQHQKFTIEEGDKFLDNIKLKGAKILRLKWNNNGIETNTVCAVSDKDGIIYDNFITNCFVMKEPTIVCTQDGRTDNGIMTPRLKTASENSDFTGMVSWTRTDVAEWIWGSDRGRVTITHDGHYSNGSFSHHNFNASHYFSLGNSEAKVSVVNSNTIAYGYGLSTPYISISITLTGSNYTVSFSTTIGSHCGGSGQHTHPLTI